MNDTIYLDLRGHIEIFNEDELIYSEKNAITNDAIFILLNSLNTTGVRNGIDTLKVSVGFSIIKKPISEAIVNNIDNSITFTTILVENDFNGNINELSLESIKLGKLFSTKSGLNINKDNNMRLKINWKIIINKA